MNPQNLLGLEPADAHNKEMVGRVHPHDWVNPKTDQAYNLVIIGGGTAGLVAATGAAGLGARVALIEKRFMGGDCLVTGCVPSKALIRAARAVAAVKNAAAYGVRVEGPVQVDFAAVMERMRRLRAQISEDDSAATLKERGVDVYLGAGRFTGRRTVEVAGRTLRFAKALIATGSRAVVPPIEGLDSTGYLTNDLVQDARWYGAPTQALADPSATRACVGAPYLLQRTGLAKYIA